MSEVGQSLPKWTPRAMSGLPSLATAMGTSLDVSKVP